MPKNKTNEALANTTSEESQSVMFSGQAIEDTDIHGFMVRESQNSSRDGIRSLQLSPCSSSPLITLLLQTWQPDRSLPVDTTKDNKIGKHYLQ